MEQKKDPMIVASLVNKKSNEHMESFGGSASSFSANKQVFPAAVASTLDPGAGLVLDDLDEGSEDEWEDEVEVPQQLVTALSKPGASAMVVISSSGSENDDEEDDFARPAPAKKKKSSDKAATSNQRKQSKSTLDDDSSSIVVSNPKQSKATAASSSGASKKTGVGKKKAAAAAAAAAAVKEKPQAKQKAAVKRPTAKQLRESKLLRKYDGLQNRALLLCELAHQFQFNALANHPLVLASVLSLLPEKFMQIRRAIFKTESKSTIVITDSDSSGGGDDDDEDADGNVAGAVAANSQRRRATQLTEQLLRWLHRRFQVTQSAQPVNKHELLTLDQLADRLTDVVGHRDQEPIDDDDDEVRQLQRNLDRIHAPVLPSTSLLDCVVLFVAACRVLGYNARLVHGIGARKAPSSMKKSNASSKKRSAAVALATAAVTDEDDDGDDGGSNNNDDDALSPKRKKTAVKSKYFSASSASSSSSAAKQAAATARAAASLAAASSSTSSSSLSKKGKKREKGASWSPLASLDLNRVLDWAEIWCPVERRWVSVCPVRGLVDDPSVFVTMAGQQARLIPYCIGVEPGAPPVDVSIRYASDWQATLVHRGHHNSALGTQDQSNDWWDNTLKLSALFTSENRFDLLLTADTINYKCQMINRCPAFSLKDREGCEQQEFRTRTLTQPMPTTISGFKNHPVYALESQLTTYQAIYPSDCSVGEFRGKKVYPRSAVHHVQSQDKWIEEAKTILPNVQPIKRVKKRAKPGEAKRRKAERERLGKTNGSTNSDASGKKKKGNGADDDGDDDDDDEQETIGLYGSWQTEDYKAPLAVDGKVPRNGYGNIYLFKPSMLPANCAHVRLPRAKGVANKLGIDAVPAMVGWDRSGRQGFPLLDGVVVLKEEADRLTRAVLLENAKSAATEHEKRHKKVVARWRKLANGLKRRQQVEQTYSQLLQ